MSTIDDYIANNAKYAEGFDSPLPIVPSKHVTIVSCMDSRMDLFAIIGMGPGEAHVIRNAGGIVDDATLRSLLISQRLLQTKEIMLIHHTDCGMTKFTEEEMREDLNREVGFPPSFALGAFTSSEDNLRSAKRRIAADPFLLHKEVRAFIYDVKTGKLKEVN